MVEYGYIRACVMVHTHTRIYGVYYYYGDGPLLLSLFNLIIKRKAIKLEFKWAPIIEVKGMIM